VSRVERIYPFIEAEKLNSHIDQDGQNTAPGSVPSRGNVKRACELLEVSRSAYYQHRATQAAGGSTRQQRDAVLTEKIRTIHTTSGGTYGSPRVHADLSDAGVRVGRKRVARLMRAHDLVGATPRRWITTTTPDPQAPARADLIGRDFTVDPHGSNARWCGDITYIRTWEGWLFLATVIDLASRRVVGWATADHLRTDLIEDALRQAVASRRPPAGVVFHSDRGCQYTSTQFASVAEELGVRLSVGRRGQCWDNAVSESFFVTIKKELIHRRPWPTRAATHTAIFNYIEGWYNTRRRHSSLGNLSPAQYENQATQAAVPAA
jgi:transposase InsO family protein